MLFRLALALLALAAICVKPANSQTYPGPLYWCEAAHAYYPTVATCPVPGWRVVNPTELYAAPQAAVPPRLNTSHNGTAGETDAYRDGVAAGRDLRTWSDAQAGDRSASAQWWAKNRSDKRHPSCVAAAPAGSQEFIAGCEEAKRRLDPIDSRRHRDADYRAGFNYGWEQRLSSEQSPPAPRTNGAPTETLYCYYPNECSPIAQPQRDLISICRATGDELNRKIYINCTPAGNRKDVFSATGAWDLSTITRDVNPLIDQAVREFCSAHTSISCAMYRNEAYGKCQRLIGEYWATAATVKGIRHAMPGLTTGQVIEMLHVSSYAAVQAATAPPGKEHEVGLSLVSQCLRAAAR